MGTVFSLSVSLPTTAPEPRAAALDRAITTAVAWLHEVDDRFTTYRPSDWVAHVEGRLDLDEAHPDIRYVSLRCDELQRATSGWFDPSADPTRPRDPAAFVKGWATQRAGMILSQAADEVLVNGGGDIFVGHRREPWRIGIQHPARRDQLIATVELVGGAIATSGSYERGAHIRHPVRQRPSTRLASVTVVGPDLGEADAYSTALYACDGEDVAWFPASEGYAAHLVDGDGTTRTIGRFATAHAA